MSLEWWFQAVKDGGAAVSVLLLGALVWMNVDRNRLIAENQEKDKQLADLAERTIIVMTELRTFLFNIRN